MNEFKFSKSDVRKTPETGFKNKELSKLSLLTKLIFELYICNHEWNQFLSRITPLKFNGRKLLKFAYSDKFREIGFRNYNWNTKNQKS